MIKTANNAQKFLLENNCNDLILNDSKRTKPEDRIYASDIMMMFLKKERKEIINRNKEELNLPAVLGSLILMLLNLGGVIIWIQFYISGKYVEWWVFLLITVCGLTALISALIFIKNIRKILKYI